MEYDYDLSPAHPFTDEKSGGALTSQLAKSVVVNPLAPPTQSFNAMDNIVWSNGNPYKQGSPDEKSKELMKAINASKQPARSFREVAASVSNSNKENIKQRSLPIDFSRPPSPQPAQKEPSPDVIDLDTPPKEPTPQKESVSASVPNSTFANMSKSFQELLEKGKKTKIITRPSPTDSQKESGLSKLKPRRLDVLKGPRELRVSPSNAVSVRNTANEVALRASPLNAVARRTSPNRVALRASPSNAVASRASPNRVALRASPSNAVSVRNTANQVARRASPPKSPSVEPGVATLGPVDLAALGLAPALARRKGQTQLPPVPPTTLPTGIRRLPRNEDYGIFPSLPLKSYSKVNKNTFSLNLL
jgi:hypothetical protein